MKSHIELTYIQHGPVEDLPCLVRIDTIEEVQQLDAEERTVHPCCGARVFIKSDEGTTEHCVEQKYESIRNQLAIKREKHAERSAIRER